MNWVGAVIQSGAPKVDLELPSVVRVYARLPSRLWVAFCATSATSPLAIWLLDHESTLKSASTLALPFRNGRTLAQTFRAGTEQECALKVGHRRFAKPFVNSRSLGSPAVQSTPRGGQIGRPWESPPGALLWQPSPPC